MGPRSLESWGIKAQQYQWQVVEEGSWEKYLLFHRGRNIWTLAWSFCFVGRCWRVINEIKLLLYRLGIMELFLAAEFRATEGEWWTPSSQSQFHSKTLPKSRYLLVALLPKAVIYWDKWAICIFFLLNQVLCSSPSRSLCHGAGGLEALPVQKSNFLGLCRDRNEGSLPGNAGKAAFCSISTPAFRYRKMYFFS